MKKKLLYGLALLLGATAITSCKDDDNTFSVVDDLDRMPMTMFRNQFNTNISTGNDPYETTAIDLNTAHLTWFGVEGAAGYEIKYGLASGLTSGKEEDWTNPERLIDQFTVGPNTLEYDIPNLEYATDYRFAIRVLSPKGEAYHSKWYGYGDGRQWSEYQGVTTGERYPTPAVITCNNKGYESFDVVINLKVADSGSASDIAEYKENFFTEMINGEECYVAQKLTVVPSLTNPDAVVDPKWSNYTLTPEDKERGYVRVDGLSPNSVYVVNLVNENIPIPVDAIYNTMTYRTKGDPGEPILIKHYCAPNDTINGAVEFNACRLDTIIKNYNADISMAEGQTFYLEGDKAYYFEGNTELCKGFTMATNPEDLAAGKRAKVYLGGIGMDGTTVRSNNFLFGRQKQAGEADAPIQVESIIFKSLDFDCPLARNFGEGGATGNYFANMYSNGMAVTFDSFEVYDCTFQRMVRGFIRVQGSKVKHFKKMIIDSSIFMNCGYYDTNGRGYAWIAGDGKSPKSNIFNDVRFTNNTFYDSPRTCMFTDNGKNLAWGADISYHFTLENNTFINFSTRSTGRKLFDLRYLPGGSTITVKRNLFVLTKAEGDNRKLYFEGMDIRSIGGNGQITFDIQDNYSVGSESKFCQVDGIFTGAAFSASKNSAGAYMKATPGVIQGAEELKVKIGSYPLKATDLFTSPNPPYTSHDPKKANKRDHEAPADIYKALKYKQTPEVLGHEIFLKGIGDPRWR